MSGAGDTEAIDRFMLPLGGVRFGRRLGVRFIALCVWRLRIFGTIVIVYQASPFCFRACILGIPIGGDMGNVWAIDRVDPGDPIRPVHGSAGETGS